MGYRAIVHITGSSEPIEGEIDDLPPPNSVFLALKHRPRGKRGELGWVDYRTKLLLLPFSQIISVEIMDPNSEEVESKTTTRGMRP